jgi:hypothetical protein
MMSDICRGVEDLVGCGERILSQCLEDDMIARMSERILINMELLLDSLAVTVISYYISVPLESTLGNYVW